MTASGLPAAIFGKLSRTSVVCSYLFDVFECDISFIFLFKYIFKYIFNLFLISHHQNNTKILKINFSFLNHHKKLVVLQP
jgi:glutathionyl-hydroquinone reductase